MIGFGTTRTSQFFIYGVFDKLRRIDADQNNDTLGCFFKILVWSLTWLARGQWPDRHWDGTLYLGIRFYDSKPFETSYLNRTHFNRLRTKGGKFLPAFEARSIFLASLFNRSRSP